MTPSAKREAIAILVVELGLSISRGCRIVRFSRAAHYRVPQSAVERDGEVIAALREIVEKSPRAGFWKCFDRLRQPLTAPSQLNQIWALDFMSDALYGGRKFRTLNVIDEGNREALAIEASTSIPSVRVVRVLEELVATYGKPEALRMDNGPEFTAEVLRDWCRKHAVDPRHIQRGKPDQNAYVERFNRSYREEVLDAYLFASIEEVRGLTEEWIDDDNGERPHDSLNGLPPQVFMSRLQPTGESSSELAA